MLPMKVTSLYIKQSEKDMEKVVINNCYGGYSLSYQAMKWLSEHGCKEAEEEINNRKHSIERYLSESGESERKCSCYCNIEKSYFYPEIPRHHPLLVQCVEELGKKANGICSELKVVTFEGDLYRITEYDGLESLEIPEYLDWEDCSKY